jgi:hypothetical protein
MSHYMHRHARPEVLKVPDTVYRAGHELPLPQLRHVRWHSKNAVKSPWLSFLYLLPDIERQRADSFQSFVQLVYRPF